MSFFGRRRSVGSVQTSDRSVRRRPAYRKARGFESLESRRMLARDFLQIEPGNDVFSGQQVQHFAPAELGVVDSRTTTASITDGDLDYFNFQAAATGRIDLTLTNNGGNPSGDADALVSLTLQVLNGGGTPIQTVVVPTSGGMGTLTINPVNEGTTYFARDRHDGGRRRELFARHRERRPRGHRHEQQSIVPGDESRHARLVRPGGPE